MNDLISIIIPVYKVEKYLNKCIDSVIGQTYKNLEIILVDDGSPDNCPRICNEYASIDKRAIVIHKENGGLSSARNAGLDIAKGEYIFFLDSDDYIAENTIERLYKALVLEKADIAIGNMTKINMLNKEEYKTSIDIKLFDFNNIDDFLLFFNSRIAWRAPWAKLYKVAILKNNDDLRFPVGVKWG